MTPTMEQFLNEQGYLVRPIVGTSMLPLLEQEKDTVHLVPVRRALVAGDVPMYKRPNGAYVLHRIHVVKDSYYIIRGDNCAFYEKVPKAWVIGVADGFSKDGRYISVQDDAYRAYVERVLKGDGIYTDVVTRRIKEQGRVRVLLSFMFPSYTSMKERYPVLRRFVPLLPLLYVWRWLTFPFSRNGRHAFASACRALFSRKPTRTQASAP